MKENQVIASLFEDLTVVELASVLAGPAVGMFFAELGARVIKIENPLSGGDVTRCWKLPTEDKSASKSAYYASINWGKEVYFIDFSNPEGLKALFEWIAEADVVISNFRPSSLQKLGLDAGEILAQQPGLIWADISGFGLEDKRPAFDIVLQAEAGYLFMTGEPGGPPVKMPVALIDIIAAHQVKEGVLIALIHRLKTGKGGRIHVSLFEAALASLANQATNWLMASTIPQKMGTLHPNIAPYGDVFVSRDGKYLVLAIGNDVQFQKLLMVLGLKDHTSNPRFLKNTARVANRTELQDLLTQAIAQFSSSELLQAFRHHAIPFGLMRSMEEVFENPLAQSMILEEIWEDGTISKRVKTAAFHFSPNPS